MNNKPQSQDEPKTAFIPEIEVPEGRAQGKIRYIKPCPFCGGVENVDVFFGQLADIPKYKITCIPCDVTLIDDRPDKVIANWNNRASPLPSSIPTEVQKEEAQQSAEEFAEGMMGLGKFDPKKWHHADAMLYNTIVKSVNYGAKIKSGEFENIRQALKDISLYNNGFIEYFRRHDYRLMYELWERVYGIATAYPVSSAPPIDGCFYKDGHISKNGRLIKLVTPHTFIDNQIVIEGLDYETGIQPYTNNTVAYSLKRQNDIICPSCKNNFESPNYNCDICKGFGYTTPPIFKEDEKLK